MSRPIPHSGPGRLQLVGAGRLQRIGLGEPPGPTLPKSGPFPGGVRDRSLHWSRAAGTPGAPWWLGQNLVESRSWFLSSTAAGGTTTAMFRGEDVLFIVLSTTCATRHRDPTNADVGAH